MEVDAKLARFARRGVPVSALVLRSTTFLLSAKNWPIRWKRGDKFEAATGEREKQESSLLLRLPVDLLQRNKFEY